MRRAGVPERRPEAPAVVRPGVELPAELTDVRHAEGEDRDVADAQLARGEVREGGIAHVRARHGAEDVAGPRAPQPEADSTGRDVADRHGPIVRQVAPQPRGVVVAERGPGHEQERLVRDAGHGQVGLDPPARVEKLGVDDGPDRPIDPIGAHPLEERKGSRASDLELGERALVEQARRGARRERLGADRR